jgi:Flp pilus assembly protein CpaB
VSRRATIDRRTILGAVLAVVAGVAVVAATRPPATSPVLVAATDLSAGVPLGEQQVEIRRMVTAEGLVVADDPDEFSTWAPAAPLAAGEPIPASLLQPAIRRAHPDALALALDAEHAALGALQQGDLVDVYATGPAPDDEAAITTLVASEVFVADVASAPERLGSEPTTLLLLAVDRPLAETLVHAIRTADIDLVRVGR